VISIPLTRHELANGLTVVLAPDASVPIVAVNVWYKVGSRNERAGRTGFAHLFEHMMFQGSAHVPKGGHFQLLEAAGGSMNGSTWFDRTNYFETLPAHELDLALWLEADRMGWLLPAMDQEKLDNQRDVVKNERRQRYENQPYGDWDERMQALLYPPEHPYHHTVIGSMADLSAASLEDVEGFFRTYYQPGNAVLTVAGDFEPADALRRVERYFGDIPSGGPVPPVPGRTEIEPVIGGTLREVVTAAVPLPRVYLGARIPPYTDPGFHAADVATSVLADGRASRLYRRLVREKRVAKDVVAFAAPLVTGRSFMILWATGLPNTDAAELERAVAEELDALGEVDTAEIERAVTRSETQLVQEIEQISSRADRLSMHETIFGDASHLAGEVERLRKVTASDVADFARSRLGPDNRAILTYLPEAAG
jgi:predicted Zn-dependent peptidase